MQVFAEHSSEENMGVPLGAIQQTESVRRAKQLEESIDQHVWVWGVGVERQAAGSGGCLHVVAPVDGVLCFCVVAADPGRGGSAKDGAAHIIAEARPKVGLDIVATLGSKLVGELSIPLVLKARVCGSARIHFSAVPVPEDQLYASGQLADGEVEPVGQKTNLLQSRPATGHFKNLPMVPAFGANGKVHNVFVEKGGLGVGVEPLILSPTLACLKVVCVTDATIAAQHQLGVGDLVFSVDGRTYSNVEEFLQRVKKPPFTAAVLSGC